MRLRFADCVLDLRARLLDRQGRFVPLEPKMYELLEVLIQRRPAVVTNNELDELLWPKVYVARTSLTRLVSELRGALGDTPRNSRIVRTVYKTGYAFCAEVTVETAPAVAPATLELVWKKQFLALPDGEHLAGRDPQCFLVIDGSTVSRTHARITVLAGTATVEDLGSTNGTFVNGTPVREPTRLSSGDGLSLGSEAMLIRRRSASALTVKVEHDATADEKTRRG
jgi:DNA-binding winged helix-turn-helix (wHTH) protein